jgi:hypothetical protein
VQLEDPLRRLEAREVLPAECPDRLRVEVASGAQLDERDDRLAIERIRHPDHAGGLDPGRPWSTSSTSRGDLLPRG